jgi:hypothetical protein
VPSDEVAVGRCRRGDRRSTGMPLVPGRVACRMYESESGSNGCFVGVSVIIAVIAYRREMKNMTF